MTCETKIRWILNLNFSSLLLDVAWSSLEQCLIHAWPDTDLEQDFDNLFVYSCVTRRELHRQRDKELLKRLCNIETEPFPIAMVKRRTFYFKVETLFWNRSKSFSACKRLQTISPGIVNNFTIVQNLFNIVLQHTVHAGNIHPLIKRKL